MCSAIYLLRRWWNGLLQSARGLILPLNSCVLLWFGILAHGHNGSIEVVFRHLDAENDCILKLITLTEHKQSQASSAAAPGQRLTVNYCHLSNRSLGSSLLIVCLLASSQFKFFRSLPVGLPCIDLVLLPPSLLVLSLLVLLLCQLLYSLTSAVSRYLARCLLLPSPVTLEGFYHQLTVTPYLGNAWKLTHSHTHMYSHTRSLQVGDLTLSATLAFFFASTKKTWKRFSTRRSLTKCRLLCPVCICYIAMLISLI